MDKLKPSPLCETCGRDPRVSGNCAYCIMDERDTLRARVAELEGIAKGIAASGLLCDPGCCSDGCWCGDLRRVAASADPSGDNRTGGGICRGCSACKSPDGHTCCDRNDCASIHKPRRA